MLLPAACQSTGSPSKTTAMGTANPVSTDPCATQMQGVSEALLLYYASHHQLPQKLDDLRTITEVDSPLVFVCPASGEKYMYDRTGLYAEGKSRHIIVYDPTPAHNGARWCIFTSELKPNSTLTMDVLLVPENVFETYQFRKVPDPIPDGQLPTDKDHQ
jgi:hypothetical protein